MRFRGGLVVVSLLILFGGACGGRAPVEAPVPAPRPLVWPEPPADPRIRYVGSVTGPQDAGIAKSFFGRLVETLFGKTGEYFIRPTGVAERAGVLYVADPGSQAIWIFDRPNQQFAKVQRVRGATLVSPVAVAVGPDGGVFVADSALGKVFLLDRKGGLLRTAAEDGLERPAGLAYDELAGQLYVADSLGHRIAVYGGSGARLLAWGKRGSGQGEFNHPTHLFLDRSGALLVTDALNYRVQAFDRDGRFLWQMGWHGDGSGDFAGPKGVAEDSQGHLYVVDALFDTVQIFERDGTFLLGFGERGVRPGQFWLPGGIFITGTDRIYVADSYNQRVQVFDFLGGSK
jgi:DNA-binding beta-propeller fold protein YncE